ncbi:MAG: nitroreductase family deazaflavin-dependent oxidoreductase [Cellulomonas sp.]
MGRRRHERAEHMRARYPAGRPDAEAKAIHRRYVAGPLPRLVPIAAVLEVPGRVSGATIHVPLVIVPYRAHWYLVSMFGAHANWVRNVQASGGTAVLLHGWRRPVQLVEVPAHLRAPIIRRYLLFAWGARPHMSVTWHSPLREVAAAAADYPVFRVDRQRGR